MTPLSLERWTEFHSHWRGGQDSHPIREVYITPLLLRVEHDFPSVERWTEFTLSWEVDMTPFQLERWMELTFCWEVDKTHLLLRDGQNSLPVGRWTKLTSHKRGAYDSHHSREVDRTPFLDIFSRIIRWGHGQHGGRWSRSIYLYKSFIILFDPFISS